METVLTFSIVEITHVILVT